MAKLAQVQEDLQAEKADKAAALGQMAGEMASYGCCYESYTVPVVFKYSSTLKVVCYLKKNGELRL